MKHQRPNSIVYNMDNMEFMASVPDKYYDLAVVDPPYGIGADKAQNNAALKRIKAEGKSKAGRGWKLYHETDWDNETPTAEYWAELFRVSKNQIVWGGNYFTEYLPPSMGWILWDKEQRDFSLADGELAWTSFNKALRIFEMSRGKALAKKNEQAGRFHPTQKPVELYDWIYKNYLPNGGKVIDTHLGSQSNRISAHKRGNIIFDSCELDVDYFNDGNARFDEFIMKYEPAELHPITKQGQSKLF
jgi:site-specific DNA-methyltransferase (adenine-specific)